VDTKILVIKGDNFSDPESFYDEIDRILTKDLNWKTGHNLDAFNDLLRGGFGVFEYGEQIKLIWKNTSKSKLDLGSDATKYYYEQRILSCHKSNIPIFKEMINEIEAGKGQTLFDILCEIILEHDHIQFQMEE
jgi:RNAse (barnase) inhibitor barstar